MSRYKDPLRNVSSYTKSKYEEKEDEEKQSNSRNVLEYAKSQRTYVPERKTEYSNDNWLDTARRIIGDNTIDAFGKVADTFGALRFHGVREKEANQAIYEGALRGAGDYRGVKNEVSPIKATKWGEENFLNNVGEYINGDENAKKTAGLALANRDTGFNWTSDIDTKSLSQMTEEQIKRFNYERNMNGDEGAMNYLKSISRELSAKSYEANEKKDLEKFANDHPFLAGVADYANLAVGVAMTPVALADTVYDVISGQGVNPYSAGGSAIKAASEDLTAFTTQNRNDVSKLWGFLYGAARSSAQSALNIAAYGPFATFAMGSSAGVSRMRELYDQGASESEILALGTINGIFEGVFERFSVENLVKMTNPSSIKEVLIGALKQSGIEASEEFFTELADSAADYIIRGNNSDYEQNVRQYIAMGYSEEEARKQAGWDWTWQVTEAALAGAVSGGLMGGVHSASMYQGNKSTGADLRTSNINENAVVDTAKGMEGTDAQRYANKTNGQLSDAELGRLYNQTVADSYSQLGNAETEDEGIKNLNKLNNANENKINKLADDLNEEEAKLYKQIVAEGNNAKSTKAAFDIILDYGKQGFIDDLEAHNFGLTDAQKTAIYQLGVKERDTIQKITAREQVNLGKIQRYFETDGKWKNGKLSTEGFVRNGVEYKGVTNPTRAQEDVINFLNAFAKYSGMDIVLFQSEADENGARHGANGFYSAGKIYIDINAGLTKRNMRDLVVPTLSHELVHSFKDTSPELYENMRQIALKALSERYGVTSATYVEMVREELLKNSSYTKAELSGAKGNELIMDEIVARSSEDMLTNSDFMVDMFGYLKQDQAKTFAEKITQAVERFKNWLNNFIAKYKDATFGIHDETLRLREEGMKQYFDEMLNNFNGAMEEGIKYRAATQNENATSSNEETLYANRISGYDVDGNYYENILEVSDKFAKQLLRNNNKFNNHVDGFLDKTILVKDENGNDELLTFTDRRVSKKGVNKSHKALGELKYAKGPIRRMTIVHLLDAAEMSKFQKRNSDNSHYQFDQNGWSIRRVYVLANEKIYPGDLSIAHTSEGENILYGVNIDIEKGVEFDKARIPKRAEVASSTPSDKSLSRSQEKSSTNSENGFRASDRVDSDGNTLTAEQIEYFKNSKVRDENGNLEVVYHGSEDYGFTVFDPDKAADKTTLFFTNSKGMASTYTENNDNVYSLYLNITNPYEFDAEFTSWNTLITDKMLEGKDKIVKDVIQYTRLASFVDSAIDYGLVIENLGNLKESTDYFLEEVNNNGEQVFSEKEIKQLTDLAEKIDKAYAEWDESEHLDENGDEISFEWYLRENYVKPKTTRQIAKYAKANGYDGVIIRNVYDNGKHASDTWYNGNVYIAFNSEQIKSVNNAKPTLDADIRYSDRVESNVAETIGKGEELKENKEKVLHDIDSCIKIKDAYKLKADKVLTDGNLRKAAINLRSRLNSAMGISDLAGRLNTAYQMLFDDNFNKQAFINEIKDIASDVVEIQKPAELTQDAKDALDYLRNTKIKITAEQKAEAIETYGTAKALHLNWAGKMKFSETEGLPLDSAWEEFKSQWGYFLKTKDGDIENASDKDMMVNFINTYDAVRQAPVYASEWQNIEGIEYAAAEIYNQLWQIEDFTKKNPQNKEIYDLRTEHARMMEEFRKKHKEAYPDMVAIVNALMKARNTDIKNVREWSDIRQKKANERRDKRIMINSIYNVASNLNKKLMMNSGKEHIPEAYKKPLANFLSALDFSSERYLGTGVPTKKDVSIDKAFSGLQRMLTNSNNTANENGNASDKGAFLDLPAEFIETVSELGTKIDGLFEQTKDNQWVLNNLNNEELAELEKVIKTIASSINNMNNLLGNRRYQSIRQSAMDSIADIDKNAAAKVRGKISQGVHDFMQWKNALPYYASKRWGRGGQAIFSELQDGLDRLAFNRAEVQNFTQNLYEQNEAKKWDEEIHDFHYENASGTYDFKLSTSQLMYLYLLSKREDMNGDKVGVNHVSSGGIVISDIGEGKKRVVQNGKMHITPSQFTEMVNTLDDRAKYVADQLSHFMNTTGSEWGNEVTMQRFGYEGYTEKHYVPIRTDSNSRTPGSETPTEKQKSVFALLNMGWTKPLTPKAHNAIVVEGLTDVFARHMGEMATYNAMAVPVLDMYKWYSFTQKFDGATEEGHTSEDTISIRGSLERVYGKEATSYIWNLMQDLNGTDTAGRDEGMVKAFMKNAKVAAVAGNLRVAFLQPTAYLRASAVLDGKYLAKGLTRKPSVETSQKYSGTALWKSMNAFDTNISRSMVDDIKNNKSVKDKLVDASMIFAEKGDELTWGFLWNACEEYVADKTSLKRGSEEFYKKTADKFRDVVYQTQVFDSTLSKSQLNRDKSAAVQGITAFMSEPTLSLNMLTDVYYDMSEEARRSNKTTAISKYGGKFKKAMTAYVLTSVAAAIVEGFFDTWRKRDEEEEALTQYAENVKTNLLEDLNPISKIPIVKEVWDAAESVFKYGRVNASPSLEESFIQDTFNGAKDFYNLFAKDNKSSYKAIKGLLKGVSEATGIPMSNVIREVTDLWNNTLGSWTDSQWK